MKTNSRGSTSPDKTELDVAAPFGGNLSQGTSNKRCFDPIAAADPRTRGVFVWPPVIPDLATGQSPYGFAACLPDGVYFSPATNPRAPFEPMISSKPPAAEIYCRLTGTGCFFAAGICLILSQRFVGLCLILLGAVLKLVAWISRRANRSQPGHHTSGKPLAARGDIFSTISGASSLMNDHQTRERNWSLDGLRDQGPFDWSR